MEPSEEIDLLESDPACQVSVNWKQNSVMINLATQTNPEPKSTLQIVVEST